MDGEVRPLGEVVPQQPIGVLIGPPVTVPALLVGARGPRSLRLSAQIADGTILTEGTSPDGVRAARRHIDKGSLAAGRSDSHSITVYVMAATGPDAVRRLEAEQHSWGLAMTSKVGIARDATAVAEAVQRWADAGADTAPSCNDTHATSSTWSGQKKRRPRNHPAALRVAPLTGGHHISASPHPTVFDGTGVTLSPGVRSSFR